MKKFLFTLEKVLGYKRQVLEVEKSEMARLQEKLRALEEEILALESRLAELNRDLAARLKSGVSTREASECKNYQGEMLRKIQALLQEKGRLQEEAARKRQEIVRMNGDISGLERLKDRQWNDYRKLCGKEQEAAVEEFVGRARCSAG